MNLCSCDNLDCSKKEECRRFGLDWTSANFRNICKEDNGYEWFIMKELDTKELEEGEVNGES